MYGKFTYDYDRSSGYIDTIYICTNPPSPTRFLKISIFKIMIIAFSTYTPFPSQPMGIRIERLVDYYFFLLVKFSIKSAPSLFQKRCRHAFTRKWKAYKWIRHADDSPWWPKINKRSPTRIDQRALNSCYPENFYNRR